MTLHRLKATLGLRTILVALLTQTFAVLCLAASPGEPAQIHLIPMERDFPAESLVQPGIEVHRGRTQSEKGATTPTPAHRDKAFEAAGLSKDVAGWDQLDRDLFYQRVEVYSWDELDRLYPKIELKKIKRLRKFQENGE